MKKILYVHHAGSLGGAPKSLALLISDLPKDKYNPIVLMVADGPARELFIQAGAEVIIEPRLGVFHGTTVSGMSFKLFMKNILSVPQSLYYGYKWIKRIKPDVVHLNTTCLFLYAMISKKIFPNVPVITHVREPLLSSFPGKILRYMNHKFTDAYIAIEYYDLSKMRLDKRLSKVIYNSVDFNYYNKSITSNVLREELNLDDKDIIYLCLARIAKSNGVLELIQMLNNKKVDSNFHFVIAGASNNPDNRYEKTVKNIASHNPNIHILSFRKDVPELIASSDVIIIPFTEPHFSRAVIEGAAMGKPSIISNVNGLNELVDDESSGYIYELNNQDNLRNKINMLGRNRDLRRKMGTNAEIKAKKLFDSRNNSNRVICIYKKLTGS